MSLYEFKKRCVEQCEKSLLYTSGKTKLILFKQIKRMREEMSKVKPASTDKSSKKRRRQ